MALVQPGTGIPWRAPQGAEPPVSPERPGTMTPSQAPGRTAAPGGPAACERPPPGAPTAPGPRGHADLCNAIAPGAVRRVEAGQGRSEYVIRVSPSGGRVEDPRNPGGPQVDTLSPADALAEARLRAGPGRRVVLELTPGTYTQPLVLDGVDNVTLRGVQRGDGRNPGDRVVFDGRVDVPREPNLDLRTKADGTVTWEARYPAHKGPGMIELRNANNVTIEGIDIRRSWPNGVRIQNSTGVTIKNLDVVGGTNAVYATGERTRGIVIEDSRWNQDPSGRLWSSLDWQHVHHGRHNHYNGAFFQGRDIAGDVTLRNNEVRNAFNGVRIKSERPDLGRDVHIENNRFFNVSDNVVEPELHASRWRITGNHIEGFHAPMSFDGVRGHSILVAGNHFVATERPRTQLTEPPSDGDPHNGTREVARLFKLRTPLDAEETRFGPPPITGMIVRGNTFTFSDYPIRLADEAFPPDARIENHRFVDPRGVYRGER